MKGFGQNLRFWGWTIEKTALGLMFFMIILARLTTSTSDMDFAKMLPAYLIMMASLMTYINVINSIMTYIPLTVSLGSTRMQSFTAMQLMNHVATAEYIIVTYLSCYFLKNDKLLPVLQTYSLSFIGIFLLMLGLSNVVGSILMRFGRSIGTILYMIAIVLTVGVSIVFMLCCLSDSFAIRIPFGTFLEGPWLLLLGLGFDAVMLFVFGSILRKNDLLFA